MPVNSTGCDSWMDFAVPKKSVSVAVRVTWPGELVVTSIAEPS